MKLTKTIFFSFLFITVALILGIFIPRFSETITLPLFFLGGILFTFAAIKDGFKTADKDGLVPLEDLF